MLLLSCCQLECEYDYLDESFYLWIVFTTRELMFMALSFLFFELIKVNSLFLLIIITIYYYLLALIIIIGICKPV